MGLRGVEVGADARAPGRPTEAGAARRAVGEVATGQRDHAPRPARAAARAPLQSGCRRPERRPGRRERCSTLEVTECELAPRPGEVPTRQTQPGSTSYARQERPRSLWSPGGQQHRTEHRVADRDQRRLRRRRSRDEPRSRSAAASAASRSPRSSSTQARIHSAHCTDWSLRRQPGLDLGPVAASAASSSPARAAPGRAPRRSASGTAAAHVAGAPGAAAEPRRADRAARRRAARRRPAPKGSRSISSALARPARRRVGSPVRALMAAVDCRRPPRRCVPRTGDPIATIAAASRARRGPSSRRRAPARPTGPARRSSPRSYAERASAADQLGPRAVTGALARTLGSAAAATASCRPSRRSTAAAARTSAERGAAGRSRAERRALLGHAPRASVEPTRLDEHLGQVGERPTARGRGRPLGGEQPVGRDRGRDVPRTAAAASRSGRGGSEVAWVRRRGPGAAPGSAAGCARRVHAAAARRMARQASRRPTGPRRPLLRITGMPEGELAQQPARAHQSARSASSSTAAEPPRRDRGSAVPAARSVSNGSPSDGAAWTQGPGRARGSAASSARRRQRRSRRDASPPGPALPAPRGTAGCLPSASNSRRALRVGAVGPDQQRRLGGRSSGADRSRGGVPRRRRAAASSGVGHVARAQRDHQQVRPRGRPPDQVLQELQRERVGPVGVVQHEGARGARSASSCSAQRRGTAATARLATRSSRA